MSSVPESLKQILEEKEIPIDIIKEALKRPSEARYLLMLEEWSRQGEAFDDYQKFEVIHGDADVIELESFDEGYPYRKGRKVVIIPRSIPVVVRVERFDNTISPVIYEEYLYVFTKDGWKRIDVR